MQVATTEITVKAIETAKLFGFRFSTLPFLHRALGPVYAGQPAVRLGYVNETSPANVGFIRTHLA